MNREVKQRATDEVVRTSGQGVEVVRFRATALLWGLVEERAGAVQLDDAAFHTLPVASGA